jgi:hypothetical protein
MSGYTNSSRAHRRRNERLQLPSVEGVVLPGRPPGQEDARLLREPVRDGRGERHVLPDAEAGDARRVAGRGPGRLRLRAEGAAAHHAREAARRRGRAHRHLSRRGRGAGRRARPGPVPASPDDEARARAARGVPRRSSSATTPGSRTTSTPRWRRAAPRCASPTRTRRRRPSSRRRRSATCGCAGPRTPPEISAAGPTASAPSAGRRLTCTSSTRTRRRARRSRSPCARSPTPCPGRMRPVVARLRPLPRGARLAPCRT